VRRADARDQGIGILGREESVKSVNSVDRSTSVESVAILLVITWFVKMPYREMRIISRRKGSRLFTGRK